MSKSTAAVVVLATVEEYRAADVKGKAAIRKAATEAMHAAIKSGDMAGAMAAQSALESYKAPAPKSAAEVDWNGLVADRIATLRAAADALESGTIRPTGAPDEFTYEPADGTADEATVTKLATAKVTRTGDRRDLKGYIEQVVTGDFMKVSAIRRAIADVTGGEYVPSDGAIAAALFNGECTIPGVVPVEATPTSPRGAYAVHVED